MWAIRALPTVRTLALLLSISGSALAAPDGLDESAPEKDLGAEAVELGRAALDTYGHAEWENAYTQFAAAERLVHSPVFVLYMARCKRNSGQLLAARDLLRAVAREQLSADTPVPWSDAAAAAHAELGTLQQNIPSIWLQKRPESNLLLALIAGRSVELSKGGSEVELDPGEHVIEIVAADGRGARISIQVSEGRRRVPVLLPVAPAAVVPVKAASATVAPATTAIAPRSPIATSKVVAYSALGLGAVGVATGIISGLVALKRTQDLKRESCDDAGNCYPNSRSEADAASRWATVSTLSFVIGGGALVAGAGVLLFAPSAGNSRASVVVGGVF